MEHDGNALPRRFATAPPSPPAVAPDPASERPLLRRPWVWFIAYAIVLSLVAFWPQHVDKGISPFLEKLIALIPLMTYERLEFGANVALFIPFGVLLTLMLTRQRYLVVPIAFLTTFTIESVQGVMLPDRTPSVNDILANTAGACIGLVLAVLLERALAGRRIAGER
ncbi:glycopeptide antibiotics resistance protein [Microbacterium resistens]|uniref:Glycopeptide antibiotics resistance protein n=1 Tax=Microbacterium resistens TaxID=156977 RepID=A0ABU1SCC1_9MICO|nr:VanZ family protein [Microbacterium resistens]MDR6867249.1 glycopeptide antibiotics resistance protein [Microbacterium resistens]